MRKHPDADAFVREHLRYPANATTRLAFADWLDETGTPSNVAWARYIRLYEEADRYAPGAPRHNALTSRLADCARDIRVRLAIPAARFVAQFDAFLQLLPSTNMTVWLTGFDIPPALLALVPESVARECNLLPFAERGLALFVAAVDPNNMHVETVQKVAFILQRHIVLVGANPAQLHTIINSKYGNFDYDYGATFLEFDYRPLLPNDPPALAASEDSATCATWCVNRILREAAYLCADRIHLTREGQQGVIWFRLDGGWVEGGVIPSRYRGSAFTRLAQAAHISTDWVFGDTIAQIPMIGEFPIRVDNRPLRVRVTMRPTPNGPDVVLDLNREPV